MCRRRHGRWVYDTVIDDKLNGNLGVRRSSISPFLFYFFLLSVFHYSLVCQSQLPGGCGCEISNRVSFIRDERCLSGKRFLITQYMVILYVLLPVRCIPRAKQANWGTNEQLLSIVFHTTVDSFQLALFILWIYIPSDYIFPTRRGRGCIKQFAPDVNIKRTTQILASFTSGPFRPMMSRLILTPSQRHCPLQTGG